DVREEFMQAVADDRAPVAGRRIVRIDVLGRDREIDRDHRLGEGGVALYRQRHQKNAEKPDSDRDRANAESLQSAVRGIAAATARPRLLGRPVESSTKRGVGHSYLSRYFRTIASATTL